MGFETKIPQIQMEFLLYDFNDMDQKKDLILKFIESSEDMVVEKKNEILSYFYSYMRSKSETARTHFGDFSALFFRETSPHVRKYFRLVIKLHRLKEYGLVK